MEQQKEKKELIVSSDYYSSSYIVNSVYLVTIKRYASEHSLMIVDTTRADEQITTSLLAAIYRNLSRPDSDALMITNYSEKVKKVTLLEVDVNSLLDRNELSLKIDNQLYNVTQKNNDIYEEQKTQEKKDLYSDQSRRNKIVGQTVNYCDSCKHKYDDDYCGDCISDFDQPSKPSMYEMPASDNTEGR